MRRSRPRSPRPSTATAIGLLLTLSTLACSGLTGEGEDGVRYRRVSPQVAFLILRDSPDLLIVDLRTRDEFDGPQGHLARAVSIPLSDLTQRLWDLRVYRDRTFLVYCRSEGECGRSGMQILVSNGFADALLMEGGIDGWLERGFGTVRGDGSPAAAAMAEPPPQWVIDADGG